MNVDSLVNFSATSVGLLTNAKLTESLSYELSGPNTPIWGYLNDPFTRTYIVNDQGNSPVFPFDVTINGTTSRPIGTKWWYSDFTSVANGDLARMTFNSVGGFPVTPIVNMVKCGFVKVRCGTNPVARVGKDVTSIYGQFGIMQFNFDPLGPFVVSHSSSGGISSNGAQIAISTGTYFYQMLRSGAEGKHKVRLYDALNGYAILGTSISELEVESAGAYTDHWQNGYFNTPVDADLWFGPAVYVYGATDFLDLDAAGTANITTLNATTLKVG